MEGAESVTATPSPAFSSQWATATTLAAKVLADRASFDESERNYKLEIVDRLQHLFAAAESGAPLADPLKAALAQPPNNLLSWQVADRLRKWGMGNEEGLRGSLTALAADGPAQARVDAFLTGIPGDVLPNEGARLSVASCFLMGLDHTTFPTYRPTVFERTEKALGWPRPVTGASDGATYEEHLRFANLFLSELSNGLDEDIDMLDAQSLLFIFAKYDDPAFEAWRHGGGVNPSTDALAASVKQFRAEHPYTDEEKPEKDLTALALAADWRPALTPEALEHPDWEVIAGLFGSKFYGNLGPAKSAPLHLMGEGSEQERSAFAEAIRELLHGNGDLADRLAGFLSADLPGIKETVAMKLLSVVVPERILPVFKVHGKNSKAELMVRSPVGLQLPEAESPAELAIESNDLIRERLVPYFDDDTYGMSRYLYWLADEEAEAEGEDADDEGYQALSDALYLDDSGWIEDAVDLLKRKRQLIFYGPPGTGKTYIALKLMKELAPLDEQREVVQFHPSYSYEDFVRGYRPVDNDGQLSYRVAEGPLVRLAEKARESLDAGDDKPYVLLIDEINRGNLPRILGELLYLLEYRTDEDGIQLLYGHDAEEPFTLPENLWILGTMNTADRSIGLIDAALRRRFHFKALFPGDHPIVKTLRRWLQVNGPSEIADYAASLVDRLNARLMEQQGTYGENLKVGHSYFMEKDLDTDLLLRIWASDVLPALEEQLFGREVDVKATFSVEALESEQGNGQDDGAPTGEVEVGSA